MRFSRKRLWRVLFKDIRFRSVYPCAIHLGQLADFPSFRGSFKPNFILAEKERVVHWIAALVVVARV